MISFRPTASHLMDPIAMLLQRWRENPGGSFRWRVALDAALQASADAAAPADITDGPTHTEVQGWLRDLGHALGYTVWIASNDQGRVLGHGRLGDGCLTAHGLYLVAPDAREDDVRAQFARPAFQRIGELAVRFIPYGALAEHRRSMARFGSGQTAIEAIARAL